MKWDIHIHDPKTKTSKTFQLEVPGTQSINDSAAAYAAARRAFPNVPQKYMLALPHRGENPFSRKTAFIAAGALLGGFALVMWGLKSTSKPVVAAPLPAPQPAPAPAPVPAPAPKAPPKQTVVPPSERGIYV
jgi:hypothetical protein